MMNANMGTAFLCRDKSVTLRAKKLFMGFDKVSFVGHDLDASGISMSQKRVESAINFAKPTTLTELQSFLGLVNYFRDHIHQHSTIAHPLHLMVSYFRH
jgi:hypothetical protein